MAQIDDLNTALQAQNALVQALLALTTKIDADVDALKAKIGTGTATDLTTQIAAVQSENASLTTANAQLTATDTKATS